jgi:hypothetical protein
MSLAGPLGTSINPEETENFEDVRAPQRMEVDSDR